MKSQTIILPASDVLVVRECLTIAQREMLSLAERAKDENRSDFLVKLFRRYAKDAGRIAASLEVAS